MFEQLTESARQVVVFAQEEASALRFSHIGSEALLLGLLREEEGLAARTLASLGMSVEKTRLAVKRYVASGDEPVQGLMPFTPRAKQLLQQASTEAAALDRKFISSEHILLALTTIEEGVGMNVLRDFDLDATNIRDLVLRQLADFTPLNPPASQRSRTRWRRARGAEAGPSTDPFRGFDVRPNDEVTGVLIGAAARALEDGRTETSIGDLLITLSRAERLRPVLTELPAGEARIRAALQRLDPGEPPAPAHGT
ncbi:MAG: Clp protease N-terminal domain-containing protein [Solirubrobacteraceae bacterium]